MNKKQYQRHTKDELIEKLLAANRQKGGYSKANKELREDKEALRSDMRNLQSKYADKGFELREIIKQYEDYFEELQKAITAWKWKSTIIFLIAAAALFTLGLVL